MHRLNRVEKIYIGVILVGIAILIFVAAADGRPIQGSNVCQSDSRHTAIATRGDFTEKSVRRLTIRHSYMIKGKQVFNRSRSWNRVNRSKVKKTSVRVNRGVKSSHRWRTKVTILRWNFTRQTVTRSYRATQKKCAA